MNAIYNSRLLRRDLFPGETGYFCRERREFRSYLLFPAGNTPEVREPRVSRTFRHVHVHRRCRLIAFRSPFALSRSRCNIETRRSFRATNFHVALIAGRTEGRRKQRGSDHSWTRRPLVKSRARNITRITR